MLRRGAPHWLVEAALVGSAAALAALTAGGDGRAAPASGKEPVSLDPALVAVAPSG